MQSYVTFDQQPQVVALQQHYQNVTSKKHLKDLLQDEKRNEQLLIPIPKGVADFTHTKIDIEGLALLDQLADSVNIKNRVNQMMSGEKINQTEKREVGHYKLRSPNCPEVEDVRQKIKSFASQIRSGERKGFSGKKLSTVCAIGIGGSYLGPEFVYEALRYSDSGRKGCEGMKLKFLANVDPIDFERAVDGINVEETLFIVVSKTFTTAETMLNARTARQFILSHYQGNEQAIASHMCAVSTNLESTGKFGIAPESVFGFWDWVGGRFSVSSAVGLLPLALFYGWDTVDTFLSGMHQVDLEFNKCEKRDPCVMLGLIGFYNTYICGHACRTILPYCQALLRFPAHIQQLDMESNGKSCSLNGNRLSQPTGPIIFGEPGTNGQHSFYQLMHQGRVIPAEFIGFTESQIPRDSPNEVVSAHDELMSNFFAQPDALALGKTYDELKEAGVEESLLEHKWFSGDRPSLSLLFKGPLNAYNCGQLLAMYEHRVAVEGFIYDINSFDQWGVELGKKLGVNVRNFFAAKKAGKEVNTEAVNPATRKLLSFYME